MSSSIPTLSAGQEHHLEWNDRLQDWLDGETDASVETHLGSCGICQARLAELEQLDQALTAAAPKMSLDAAFDARIFAQIDGMDESKRIAARQRIEQELQENLRALSRGWRRTLAFVVPGVVAGVAIAFALATWFDDSGLVRTLAAENARAIGVHAPDLIRMTLTALFGATVGLVVARWLATVAD